MAPNISITWIWSILLIIFAIHVPVANAVSQSLCSSFNTGADSDDVTYDYQSAGRCFDNCKAQYAFAIVKGKSCWCSDYAPADTTSLGSCSSPCPGYPFEQCGSDAFFGYIAIGKAPAGTTGASQSQSSTSSPPEVSTSISEVTPSTVLDTTTETTTTATPVRPTTSYVPISVTETTTNAPAPAPTTSSVPASSSSEEPSPKSTWTPTPVTSVMTVTGQVKTITITPTIPPNGAVVAQPSRDGGFMSHPGKVAGLFVGIALIICLLAAALIWFFIRRKRNAEAEAMASTAGGETPQRRQSKMSTIGLLGGTRRTNKRRSVPKIQTSGWGPGNSMEKSPVDTPVDYRRTSYPRVVDQRLEPAALWNPLQDNGSHVSIQSFRDDQDYSRRMLRVGDPGAPYG
ncbi:MAG: hypothetical protein LQ339_001901 [Xanthoria mediterranea]|nr:MAG: hypothetical protein LQ339_001901 [Xanthoria mediterranea]